MIHVVDQNCTSIDFSLEQNQEGLLTLEYQDKLYCTCTYTEYKCNILYCTRPLVYTDAVYCILYCLYLQSCSYTILLMFGTVCIHHNVEDCLSLQRIDGNINSLTRKMSEVEESNTSAQEVAKDTEEEDASCPICLCPFENKSYLERCFRILAIDQAQSVMVYEILVHPYVLLSLTERLCVQFRSVTIHF